jgi:hypothetical protein
MIASLALFSAFVGFVWGAGQVCPRPEIFKRHVQGDDHDLFSLIQANGVHFTHRASSSATSGHSAEAASSYNVIKPVHGRTDLGTEKAVAEPHPLDRQGMTSNTIEVKTWVPVDPEVKPSKLDQSSAKGAQQMKTQKSDSVILLIVIPISAVVLTLCVFGTMAAVGMFKPSQDKLTALDPQASRQFSSPTVQQAPAPSGNKQSPEAGRGITPVKGSQYLLQGTPVATPVGSAASVPLCPELTMPSMESRFAVKVEDLQKLGLNSSIDMVGMTQNPLLTLHIRNGSKIDICLPHPNAKPRFSLSVPQSTGMFEIRGPDNQVFGGLKFPAEAVSEVFRGSHLALVVEGTSANMKFAIKDSRGKAVAMAKVNTEDYRGGDHFEIRTLGGTDALLVVGVVLAIVIFVRS